MPAPGEGVSNVTYEEKIAYLEEKLKQAKRVTFEINLTHRIAADQESTIEEALAECQSKLAHMSSRQ